MVTILLVEGFNVPVSESTSELTHLPLIKLLSVIMCKYIINKISVTHLRSMITNYKTRKLLTFNKV